MQAGIGDVTEAAVGWALVKLGCSVLVPFGQTQPYDLVVDRAEAGFARIQCKTGWEREGCILFNSCSTDHGEGRLDYRGKAEYFGVYFPPSEEVFIVPVEEAATRTTSMRLRPTANGQRRRVRQAEDYEIRLWADRLRPPGLVTRLRAV